MSNRPTRIVHGVTFPADWTDPRCVLWLYLFGPKLSQDPFWRPDVEGVPESYTIDGNPSARPYTGMGRFQHVQELTAMFMPKAFEWHDWSKLVVRTACENSKMAASGSGTSGKSTDLGLESFWFWAAAPTETAVILVSTTLESAKKRIWKEVSRFYNAFSTAVGGYRDATIGSSPRPYISPLRADPGSRFKKRDEAHGIYVSALQKKADVEQEMEFIKGFHPRRIRVVVDEMDSLRQHGKALHKVFNENLASGTTEASFVVLGNDPSLFNELGEIMQREWGQPIIEADKEWTSVHGFACLRLDAWDSPNIRDKGKWTGLIRQQDIDRITANGTKMNTPGVYVQLKGLHPPEGTEDTLLSEPMLVRFRCRDEVEWAHDYVACGAIDPSHGGDNCTIRRFDYGLDVSGKMRIHFWPPKHLTIVANQRDNPEEYQVADQAKAFCFHHGIKPQNFIGDNTGTAGGCMAVLRRQWSPLVEECSFAGAPSDMLVSDEDPVPGKDRYDRRVTELCFAFREFVQADMVRGLDNVTAAQACSRLYELVKKKTKIERKEEMKARGLSSPDELDCTVAGIDLLRRKGIMPVVMTPTKEAASADWEREIEENDFDAGPVYEDEYAVED